MMKTLIQAILLISLAVTSCATGNNGGVRRRGQEHPSASSGISRRLFGPNWGDFGLAKSFLENAWKNYASILFDCNETDGDPAPAPDDTPGPPAPAPPAPVPNPTTPVPTGTPGPTPSPTPPPPTASPTTLAYGHAMEMLDGDLLRVARAALGLGVEEVQGLVEESDTLRSKVEAFDGSASRTTEMREELQQLAMAAISKGTRGEFIDLIDPQNDLYVEALKSWNDAGAIDIGGGQTKRSQVCEMINGPRSMVPSDVRDCMCGNEDPYIRCQLMMGSAGLEYHALQQQGRRLQEATNEPSSEGSVVQSVDELEGDMDNVEQMTCNLVSTPPTLLAGGAAPNLEELLGLVSGNPKGVSVSGSCPMHFLDVLEIQGYVAVSMPNLPWMTNDGALGAIADGSLPPIDELMDVAESTKGSIAGRLCLAIESDPGLQVLGDMLTFLGIPLCFAELALEWRPIRGHAQVELQLHRSIFNAKAALGWQTSTALRDTLGLCDENITGTADCTSKENLFCAMEEGERVGSFELGLDFAIWNPSIFLSVGENPYDDCEKWDGGTLCFLDTTCNACSNPATYWYGKASTACGDEPKWEDGTLCLPGTSCNNCQNPATYWYEKGLTACGTAICWEDGTVCLEGTTCGACCNPSSFWSDDKNTFACGDMPCWQDGAVCAEDTTCNECCNGSSFWTDQRNAFACGDMPCLEDGDICLAGSTCASDCCNPSSFWPDHRYNFACGQYQPCWGDGTVCLEDTTCGACCNPSSFWPDHRNTFACGDMPCWEDGTVCEEGTTCNECCNGSSFWSDHRFSFACGDMPCWETGTRCRLGRSSCSNCCTAAEWNWGSFGYLCG